VLTGAEQGDLSSLEDLPLVELPALAVATLPLEILLHLLPHFRVLQQSFSLCMYFLILMLSALGPKTSQII
jgi:hypothetical protein